jgi:iron complex transport system substrate-binding protein
LLERSDVIMGVSAYAVRPQGVKKLHPVISTFTHANIKKITGLKPDLVIGFSDIQKDIARELIGEGIDVYITNQRSLDEILRTLNILGHIIGESDKTKIILDQFKLKMAYARELSRSFKWHPRVYIEEWDEPRISGIRWFSELVELCGGEDIYKERSHSGSLARDRFSKDEEIVKANPDVILACWCGKKVELQKLTSRAGYSDINAVKNGQVFELSPEIFLQPGPALFLDGIDQLLKIFCDLQLVNNP